MAPKSTDSLHKVQKAKRNERERKRVNQVNLGFVHLRDRVPLVSNKQKLSKVETLREATKYIQQLQSMLESSNNILPPINQSFHQQEMEYNQSSMKNEHHQYSPSSSQCDSSSFYYPSSSSSENSFNDLKYSYQMHH